LVVAQDGAYLYLCGDAERMAPDVDAPFTVSLKSTAE